METSEMKKDEMSSEEWVRRSASFLQSKDWSNFQESLGRSALQFNFLVENKYLKDPRLTANFYFYRLPFFGGYWYCPRGPVGDQEAINTFLQDFPNFSKNFLNKKQSKDILPIFIRIEFNDFPNENLIKNIRSFEFEESPYPVQPKKTLILDLKQSEYELLNNMRPKTRYNIKVAQKNNLNVREINTIEAFLDLMRETSSRNKFSLHPDMYYRKLFEFFSNPLGSAQINPQTFQQDNQIASKLISIQKSSAKIQKRSESVGVKILGSFWGNELLAANMVIFYGKRATYIHGGSCIEHKNLMASYLLHWETIKLAKKMGFEEYDFWGIDEARWPGITRFKKGFGGKETLYAGAYDFPLNKFWYKIYKIISKLKRWPH